VASCVPQAGVVRTLVNVPIDAERVSMDGTSRCDKTAKQASPHGFFTKLILVISAW
jgi:hypothetical protein